MANLRPCVFSRTGQTRNLPTSATFLHNNVPRGAPTASRAGRGAYGLHRRAFSYCCEAETALVERQRPHRIVHIHRHPPGVVGCVRPQYKYLMLFLPPTTQRGGAQGCTSLLGRYGVAARPSSIRSTRQEYVRVYSHRR